MKIGVREIGIDYLGVMCVFVCVVEMGSFLVVVKEMYVLMLIVVCKVMVIEEVFGVVLLYCLMYSVMFIEVGYIYLECVVMLIVDFDDMLCVVVELNVWLSGLLKFIVLVVFGWCYLVLLIVLFLVCYLII